jgi:hypothetical protein
MHLNDEQFDKRCDLLGSAIHCPLEIGFRSRLRNRTTSQPAPTPAHSQSAFFSGSPLVSSGMSVLTAAAQPSTEPAGSYISISEHVRVVLPSAVMCDAVTPHCSEQPDTRCRPSQVLLAEPVGAAQPTASAHQSESANTEETVHVTAAAEIAGETCAATTTEGKRKHGGVYQLFDQHTNLPLPPPSHLSQRRASFLQGTTR